MLREVTVNNLHYCIVQYSTLLYCRVLFYTFLPVSAKLCLLELKCNDVVSFVDNFDPSWRYSRVCSATCSNAITSIYPYPVIH
jgi:hypothetical protein